ncbi:LysE family translocator [Hyphomicrobium sp.]|uniref:LysE family translocator n=1 Tax=Hyphomicrobium sp. TaxID=82 RepID=UPI000FA5EEA9|nr:LysE family translocator [Hyphomicrobium sp.]RUO99991.1 MAG: LysE family translocator [Hyphomicrobium sp.]
MSPALSETSSSLVPLAFLWVSFIIELTPGPNMTYLAVLSLVDGRRAGFAMVAGIASGLLVIGILAAFGIAAFVAESKFLFTLLRWFGVLYMVWLAYDIWSGGEPSVHHDGQSQSIRTYFGRGFITNVLNPKAAVFYVAVLPEFVDPSRNLLQQTLALSIAYAGVATLVHATIVMLASTMRPSLQDANRMRITRRILAVSLLFVAAWLLWSTAEPGSHVNHGR